MGRTTKEDGRSPLPEPKIRAMDSLWKAGIYARLSVDSHSMKNESMNTQVEIAKAFIRQSEDIELVSCYFDLGKTGTNFKRDGFECMMADIRRKKINCVIVKDFSRFGRNYIETGNYIEKIFPFMKVRFISVTDGYDSGHNMEDNLYLTMNLKNIVNELYARDISQRVKTAKKLKQEMGSYTGGVAPYGYCARHIGGKYVLIPDAATRGIVTRMFERYAEGETRKEIIRELYQKRVQRPRIYQKTKEVYCPEGGDLQPWSDYTVKMILNNPVYLGTLFQVRTCGKAFREHKPYEVGGEEVSVAEHTHEPLVCESVFYQVARRFEQQSKYSHKDGFSKKIPHREDVFKGKVYCGECGRCLIRNSSTKMLSSGAYLRHYHYSCSNIGGVDDVCENPGISLLALEKILRMVLEKEFAFSNVCAESCCRENMQEVKKRKDEIRKEICDTQKQQEELALTGSKLYLRYHEQRLSRESFLEEKKRVEKEGEWLEEREEKLHRQDELLDKEAKKINQFIRGLVRCKGNCSFDRELIESLVWRIIVYPEHRVEIIWAYSGGSYMDLFGWKLSGFIKEGVLLKGREADEQII